MRQVQLFKTDRLVARVAAQLPPDKARRIKARRIEREIQRDIDVAYAAMFQRVVQHNVTVAAFVPRASPVLH